MSESDTASPESAPGTPPASAWSLRGLVCFIGIVLLTVNLLLAGYFCYLASFEVPAFINLYATLNTDIPPSTYRILAIPPPLYWVFAVGLLVALILLQAFAPRRKITLVANAAALVLLILAIILLEISLRLPQMLLIQNIPKQ